MLRVLIYTVVLILVARAIAKFWNGFTEGMNGAPRQRTGGVPQQGVQMARDPVCGTFVVPTSAVTLSIAGERLYFCSDTCRNQFLAAPRAKAAGRSA